MEPKKVLVVEDEKLLRTVLGKRLEKDGISTMTAADGKEGLESALQHRPDLILLDIMMPHSGTDMLINLRKNEEYGKSARVIFLSNLNPDSDQIVKVIEEQEPIFYLVKANWTLDQIAEKVREVLENKE